MSIATPGTTVEKTADTRWQRLQELFSAVVELPEDQRQAFIERETADDPALREELLGLVACDTGKSTGPLTHALGNALDATTRDRRRALLGKTVGNYKLVSVLGHGGTGTVYLGERSDRQYSAQVAVKIVDSATVHGDLGLRFRAERQILASLNHPNIARLLDAGETAEDQPYLVMEYVHGEPVDRYCDRAQLDLRARLKLFLEICTAVQYAHQNLIVHRDLKPANILVTAEGAPKLLDFGIAKLLDVGDSAAMLALTRMNDRLLTPEYASPEQILGRPVTTASDVYALGVVLYELLTGLRPYVVPASASQLELERSICVSDPQRPSAAVRRSAEGGPAENQSPMPAIAAARGLTPERLHKRLAGDIDSIIMRALRKEPQHRYGSVEQLVSDIRRYLVREPVQARQGNWLYYSQRFMRRHAFGVSVSATFIGVILAFAIVMSVQRERIAHERDRARQEGQRAEKVSDFMVDVFTKAEPYANDGNPPTAADLLDAASKDIRKSEFNEQTAMRAKLLYNIGRSYRRLSAPDRAITFLREAISIGSHDSDFPPEQLLLAHMELGVALRDTGQLVEGKKELELADRLLAETTLAKPRTHALLLAELGRLELQANRLVDSERYLNQALDMARVADGPRSTEVASILNDLAAVYLWKDNVKAAAEYAREAVKIFDEQDKAETYPDRMMADSRLGEALFLQGESEGARIQYDRVLKAQRKVYGKGSKQVADTLDALARVYVALNNPAKAEELALEAVAIVALQPESSGYLLGYLRTSLAYILLKRDKFAEAEAQVSLAMEVYGASGLDPDHPYIASAEYVHGEAYLGLGQYAAAEGALTASMFRYGRAGASSAWRSARSASALGEAYYRQGKFADAEKYMVQGFTRLSASNTSGNGADKQTVARAKQRLARFYADRGERNKLDELQFAVSGDNLAANPIRPN